VVSAAVSDALDVAASACMLACTLACTSASTGVAAVARGDQQQRGQREQTGNEDLAQIPIPSIE
jgi:hypothetical protein